MATINEIKQQAEAVKNATQVGENTAMRVGSALSGLADIAKQHDVELGKKFDKESVVQESGNAEDKVMSQKAVGDKLNRLADDITYKELAHHNIRITEDSYFSNKLSPSVSEDLKIGNNGEPIILTGSDFIIKIFDVSNYKQLSVCLKKYADTVCMFMRNRSWVNPNNNIVGNVIKSEVKGIITVPEGASLLFVSSTKSETEDYVYGLSDKTTIPSVYDGICCSTKTQEYTSMCFLENQVLGKIEIKNDVQYLISNPSKNVLLINKKIVDSQNFNGISVSYDENKGCIKINGTSNGHDKIAFVNYNYKIPKGVYTMYCSANLDIVNFIFNNIGIQSGSTRTIEISEDAKITPTNTFLSLLPNVTYNNVEVYLQIEKNDKFSGFCPNKTFILFTDKYGNVSYYPRLGFCIEDGFVREYSPSEKLFFDRIKDETDCSFAFNDDINEPVKITTTLDVISNKLSDLYNIAKQHDVELGKKFDKESVVQESGNAEDKVMSQKAVGDKLNRLADDITYKELAHHNIRITEDSYFSNKLSPSVSEDLKIGNNGEPIILTGSDFIIKIFDVSNYKQLSVCLKKYADTVCMFMRNRSWVNPNNNIVGNVIKSEVKGIITVPEGASLLFVSSTKSETEDYVYGLSDKTTIPSVYDGICCSTKTQEYTSMCFLENQVLGKIEIKNDVQYLISNPSKNVLLINKKIVDSQNFNGISVSYDENKGCIKINGTSNGHDKIAFVNYNYKIPKGVYTMYCSANLDIVNFIFNNIGIQSGSTRTIEISEDAKITPTNTFLSLLPNVTYNNVEVYLQIEKNDKFSGFCPNKTFILFTDKYGNVSYYPRLGFCIEDGFVREYSPSEKLFFDRIKDETDCSFAFNDDINEPVKITTTPYISSSSSSLSVSIIDFGAKGDGVTDDTFAFEKALENSKNVFIPSGTYLISRTLYLKSGTELYGEGDKSIIKLNNPSNLDAIPREDTHQTFTDKYVYPYIVNKKGATDIYIHNLKIEGCEDDSSFTTNLQIGVLLIGAKNSKLEFLHVSKIDYFPHLVDRTTAGQTKLKSYNIGVLSCDNIRIENCISEYGGYECCRIGHDSKHVTIKNCQFNYGWRTCLQIIWGCENIVVDNCQILQDDFDICDTHAFMTIHTIKGCFAKNIHIKNCSLKGKLFAEGQDLGCFSFVDGYNENVVIENCDFELEGEYPNQVIAIFDLNGDSFTVRNNRLKGSIRGIAHTTTSKDCSIWIEGNIIETKQKSICLIPRNSYKYAKIDKNIIKSYGVTDNDGIYVYTTDECKVENLAICNNVVRAGSYGIDLSSKNVEYARISDNTILETTTPIRCLHATKSIISNNILNNSNSKIGENNNSVYQNTIVEN